jgi:ribosomal protein S27AE
MLLPISDTLCPRCHQPVTMASIELHPTRPDIAHHNYICKDCGPVMARAVSLMPAKESPAQMA